MRWHRQVTQNDIWVRGIPTPGADGRFLDQDIGDAPKIYKLWYGRKVVAAGQKSGALWVLDAATGAVVNMQQAVQQANQLGGLQNGGAHGRGKLFVHGLNGLDKTTDKGLFFGSVKAYSDDGLLQLWSFDIPLAFYVAPLALAQDVLFFVEPISGIDLTTLAPANKRQPRHRRARRERRRRHPRAGSPVLKEAARIGLPQKILDRLIQETDPCHAEVN